MATFTIELSRAFELTNGKIGLENYVIFDEDYREGLNRKILDRYWNMEIGTETIDLFVWNLRRRMNEIMPLYNQLYKSERLLLDPLNNISIKTINATKEQNETTTNANTEGVGSSSSVGNSKARAVASQTPQTMLSGNADYATSANDSNSTADNTAETREESQQNSAAESQAKRDSDTMVTGFQGSQADLLTRFRDTFLNIDLMVIEELGDLFMSVWGNGDNYSRRDFYQPFFPVYWV